MESPIAIVGMSCRFAGCSTPTALWDAIMRRANLLTVPNDDAALPFGAESLFKRPYPTRVGQLGDLYACVPAMQTFPRQVNAGENQDLYFVTQLAFDALVNAGLHPNRRDSINGTVRLGYAPPFNASTVNWLQHTMFIEQTMDILQRFMRTASADSFDRVREKLYESLPAPNAASFLLGSGYRFVSWIARECSFSGVASIHDAGMLSGAATLMDAVADLQSGRADIALVGAVNPPLSREYLEGVAGEVEFSTKTELQPFSEDSSGTIPGEGGAFFVLKRREDALRDNDEIYALIKAVSVGHNPPDDPSRLFADTVRRADVPVKSIGLIEADGIGIKAAEDREIDIVQRLWGEHRPGGPLVGIGSIKGNIGHTFRASIAAGVVKTALALYHRVLPPQVMCERPNVRLTSLASSAYLLNEARPWITGDSANPRRAVVMGSNFDPVDQENNPYPGGRSAVVVLEEEPEVRG